MPDGGWRTSCAPFGTRCYRTEMVVKMVVSRVVGSGVSDLASPPGPGGRVQMRWFDVVPPDGFEPPTNGLEVRRSVP